MYKKNEKLKIYLIFFQIEILINSIYKILFANYIIDIQLITDKIDNF